LLEPFWHGRYNDNCLSSRLSRSSAREKEDNLLVFNFNFYPSLTWHAVKINKIEYCTHFLSSTCGPIIWNHCVFLQYFFFIKYITTLLLHIDKPQLILQFVHKHSFGAPRQGHICIKPQFYIGLWKINNWCCCQPSSERPLEWALSLSTLFLEKQSPLRPTCNMKSVLEKNFVRKIDKNELLSWGVHLIAEWAL